MITHYKSKMKTKYWYFLLLSVVAVVLYGCDDDSVMDTKLIKGQWEVASADSPEYGCIYNFTTKSENTWSWGVLTTYYLSVSQHPVFDKMYDWHVSDPDNYDTVYLDLTPIDELNSDDAWENTDTYIVEKLTASEMILRESDAGDAGIRIKFIRRNDLPQP